jgi:[ribosomal protein S5]-alanine N-acetyltransferase
VLDVRPLRASDAPAVHGLLGDPRVASWFRDAEPFSLTECEHFVQRQLAHWGAHRFGMALGWDGEECVGWSLLQHCIVDGASEVEIGWTVASERWGEGIATEPGRHALERADGLGLRSLIAYARAENGASRRVMEKLGLEFEKEFEHAARPHVLYRTPRRSGNGPGAPSHS